MLVKNKIKESGIEISMLFLLGVTRNRPAWASINLKKNFCRGNQTKLEKDERILGVR